MGEHLVKEVPSSTTGVYTSWPRLKETAHALTSMLTEEVGPRGLLYLRQREYAVTVPQDENLGILGTDDATTSVMAVLRHTGEYPDAACFVCFINVQEGRSGHCLCVGR